MDNSKPTSLSVSYSHLLKHVAMVTELTELLGKNKSLVVQQAIEELYARTAEQAITGANNGHPPN